MYANLFLVMFHYEAESFGYYSIHGFTPQAPGETLVSLTKIDYVSCSGKSYLAKLKFTNTDFLYFHCSCTVSYAEQRFRKIHVFTTS